MDLHHRRARAVRWAGDGGGHPPATSVGGTVVVGGW